ncbi:MAG: excinuclease ABC subunit UvrC [Chlamydiae bacterium]|nr:excinuclease ABC subunit UvrC [Chlamydiota bacterium]
MNSEKLLTFPLKPGVYLMKNREGKILYIGKAKILRERIKQYFSNQDSRAMIPFLISQLEEIETIVTFTEKEALLLERNLIKKHQPKYNILLKDDKTFISLMINHKNKWPKVSLVRYKENQKEDALYFGPYTSALHARVIFETLTKIFPLRQCSDKELSSRKRPCLLYSIKRCIAPCVGKCTKEEYDETVAESIGFLKGKTKHVLSNLKKKMQEASDALEFEKAGAYLKTIQQIQSVTEAKESSVQLDIDECDVINFIRKGHYTLLVKLIYRDGFLINSEHYDFSLTLESDEELLSSFLIQHYSVEKSPKEILLPIEIQDGKDVSELINSKVVAPQKGDKKKAIDLAFENAKAIYEQEKLSLSSKEELLLELKEILNLSRFPSRIECFDTSHISGSDAVASLSAFTNGEKDPKKSRVYKIKTASSGDDYSALAEVITRRLTRGLSDNDLPDLIIVDGGKGQLNRILEVFKELEIVSIDLIALTKEEARHDKGLTKERIFIRGKNEPISLNPHSSLLFFLQSIRDEAHRKAITFHRKKRSERTTLSLLDQIQGIGPLKKKALLKQFGSVKRIFSATESELLKVECLTKKDRETLISFSTQLK